MQGLRGSAPDGVLELKQVNAMHAPTPNAGSLTVDPHFSLNYYPPSQHHLCGRPPAAAQPTTPPVTVSNLHTDPYSSLLS